MVKKDILNIISDLLPILVSFILLKTCDPRKLHWKKHIEGQLIRYKELKEKANHVVSIVTDVNFSLTFITSYIPIIISAFFQLLKMSMTKNTLIYNWISLALLIVVFIASLYKLYFRMKKDLVEELVYIRLFKKVYSNEKFTWETLFTWILYFGYFVLFSVICIEQLHNFSG